MMNEFTYYQALKNSDQTEGRGHMVVIGRFSTEEAALEAARGQGVMGVGDGEVAKVNYNVFDDGVVHCIVEKVYGYRQDWNGKWGYGFVDNRDAPTNDPEFQEYLRLKAKFGA